MKVRCGRCRSEFEVTGPGRYSCPRCDTVNEVRAAADGPPPDEGMWTPPTPSSGSPSPRVSCPACSFEFIVGDVDTAVCPNCSEEVSIAEGEQGVAS